MNLKLTALGIIAAVGFAACDAAVSNTNTATNRAVANGNSNTAVVVNSNSTATNTNTGTANSNRMNANMTREEFDKDRTRYEGEAKNTNSTIGTGANDLWLWTKTRAALAGVNDLRDSTIDVDVANEVVTLEGTVGSAAQKAAAEKTAKEIDGVKSVKNMLKVSADGSTANGNANAGRTNANK